MARKNSNRRRPQARRRADGTVSRRTPPPPPLEHMIIPRGRCHYPHRKYRFTKAEVEKALAQAQARRERLGHTHREERYYECETAKGGCGSWHLTSRTSYTPRSDA